MIRLAVTVERQTEEEFGNESRSPQPRRNSFCATSDLIGYGRLDVVLGLFGTSFLGCTWRTAGPSRSKVLLRPRAHAAPDPEGMHSPDSDRSLLSLNPVAGPRRDEHSRRPPAAFREGRQGRVGRRDVPALRGRKPATKIGPDVYVVLDHDLGERGVYKS